MGDEIEDSDVVGNVAYMGRGGGEDTWKLEALWKKQA
jgi:hypothetical protein